MYRDVFYRLKLSYTRPSYTLAKDDTVNQEKFKESLVGLLSYETGEGYVEKHRRYVKLIQNGSAQITF